MRVHPRPALSGWGLFVLGLAGLALRLQALALPLAAQGADVAAAARALAEGVIAPPPHGGYLQACLALPAVLLGLDATLAVRALDVLAGAALAPLLVLLASAWRAPAQRAWLLGLLALLHPAWLVSAGGVQATGAGIACALMFGAWLAQARHLKRTRTGLALALVAASPWGIVHAFALVLPLGPHARTLRAWVAPVAAVALALALPGMVLGTSSVELWSGQPLVLALAVLVAGPLLLGLPLGPRRALRAEALSGGRLTLVVLACVLHAIGLFWHPSWLEAGPLALAPLLVGWCLLFGARGVEALGPARARTLRWVTLVGFALVAVPVVAPFLGRLLPPHLELRATRLRRLAEALEVARDVSADSKWVGCALDLTPAEAASLADRCKGFTVRHVATTTRHAGHLPPFDPADVPSDAPFALLGPAGTWHRVQPLGDGQVVVRLTQVEQFGAIVVFRAIRD